MQLRKEIVIALSLKLLGLAVLWWLFFSHPVTKDLSVEQVEKHWLGD